MAEFVRVKLKESGHEVSVAVVRDGMTVVDKPAVDRRGRPLPPKFKTSVDQAAASKKNTPNGGDESAMSKEDSK